METQTTTPQTPADRAGTVGHQTKQAAGDVAQTAGQEAKHVTREAKDQVQQLWGQTRRDLTEQASTQQTRVAGGLRELADQLGAMARATDQSGMAVGLVDDAGRRLGEAASWLDQRDPGSLLDEARGFARQRPGTFLAIAAGVGVLAGRLSRSLIDEARDQDDAPGIPGSSGGPERADSNGGTAAGGTGYGTPAVGNGASDNGSNLSHGGTATPSAAGVPASTTASTPITSGVAPATGAGANATVPGDQRADAHRSTQPIAPDGTPSPIDREGKLTAEGDDALRGL